VSGDYGGPVLMSVVVAVVLAMTVSTMAPSLQVTRTDSLADGEQVMVVGVGFPAGVEVTVGECAPGAGCNEQGGVQVVTTDAEGGFGPVPLIMAIRFGSVDCARVACEIVATVQGIAATRTRITFGTATTVATGRPVWGPTAPVEEAAGTGGLPAWPWLAGAGVAALATVGIVWMTRRRYR
jgi:hypothetical protein